MSVRFSDIKCWKIGIHLLSTGTKTAFTCMCVITSHYISPFNLNKMQILYENLTTLAFRISNKRISHIYLVQVLTNLWSNPVYSKNSIHLNSFYRERKQFSILRLKYVCCYKRWLISISIWALSICWLVYNNPKYIKSHIYWFLYIFAGLMLHSPQN